MALKNVDYGLLLDQESEIPPDISFLVCDYDHAGDEVHCHQVVRAHKLLLAVASPVFRKQFFGLLAEKSDPVCIEGASYVAFRIMIDFIYDKLQDVTLSSQTFYCLFEVRNLAEKYLLPSLILKIEGDISNKPLRPSNLLEAAESAHFYQHLFPEVSGPLSLRCQEYFSKNYPTISKMGPLINGQLSRETLLELIESEPASTCRWCNRILSDCLDGERVTNQNMGVGMRVVRDPAFGSGFISSDSEGVGVITDLQDKGGKVFCYICWENNIENGWPTENLCEKWSYFQFKCRDETRRGQKRKMI